MMESTSTAEETPHSSDQRSSLSPKIWIVSLVVASVLLLADQGSKSYIASHYLPNQFIAGNSVISLVFVTNPGGICGYAQGAGTLLTIVGVVTSAVILVSILVIMPDSLIYAGAFGSLFAGALGNLIDRLRFGYVVDFITLDLLNWPSFNLADASIIGGVALVGLMTLLEMRGGQTGGDSQPELGRNSIILLILAGLVFAVAYLFCVLRPFA